MSKNMLHASVVLAGLAALAAWTACSAPQAPPAAKANPYAEEHHPATFSEAKALATERNVPLLVDFYSPT